MRTYCGSIQGELQARSRRRRYRSSGSRLAWPPHSDTAADAAIDLDRRTAEGGGRLRAPRLFRILAFKFPGKVSGGDLNEIKHRTDLPPPLLAEV